MARAFMEIFMNKNSSIKMIWNETRLDILVLLVWALAIGLPAALISLSGSETLSPL